MKIILLVFSLLVAGIPSIWAQDNGRHWPPADSFVVLSKEASILNLSEVMGCIRIPKEILDAEITGKVVVRILVDHSLSALLLPIRSCVA